MADYSEAKYQYDTLVARERSEKKMDNVNFTGNHDAVATTDDLVGTPRRITNNVFASGGLVMPSQTAIKVAQSATFTSAGPQFTVAELRGALAKLNVSADATITFYQIDNEGYSNDVIEAVVEWTV